MGCLTTSSHCSSSMAGACASPHQRSDFGCQQRSDDASNHDCRFGITPWLRACTHSSGTIESLACLSCAAWHLAMTQYLRCSQPHPAGLVRVFLLHVAWSTFCSSCLLNFGVAVLAIL